MKSTRKRDSLVIVCMLVAISIGGADCSLNIVRDLIQYQVAGLPVLHKVVTWETDPDVALRRRKQFEELHGVKGEKLIERLGLGIDGYADERLQKQQARDRGHLGGVNNFLP